MHHELFQACVTCVLARVFGLSVLSFSLSHDQSIISRVILSSRWRVLVVVAVVLSSFLLVVFRHLTVVMFVSYSRVVVAVSSCSAAAHNNTAHSTHTAQVEVLFRTRNIDIFSIYM